MHTNVPSFNSAKALIFLRKGFKQIVLIKVFLNSKLSFFFKKN